VEGPALVVGTGGAGQRHIEALRELGIGATGPLSARDVARAPALLRDDAIRVVHVCAANDLHVPIASEALEAGKDVICEKPLAPDVAGARRLVDAARDAGRTAVVAYTYRFHPLVVELISRVRDGALGDPHLVRGAFLQDWLIDPVATDWRVDPARGGVSRVIADLGLHWLDIVEQATGHRAVAVLAELGRLHGRPTEDHAALLVRFEGGLQGACVLSQAAAGHRNDLEVAIDCASGALSWRWERPDELVVGSPGSTEVIARDRVTSTAARALATRPASSNEGRRNLLAAVYARIDGSTQAELPTFEDGLHHARFVEAAMRSAADSAWTLVE
jgi:predicted dehydrogenase